jgi:uncharacterized protein YndB with AHSA1/START domain
MLSKTNPKAVLGAKRLLNATAKEVFSVFKQPDRLAKWWGPNGFTNTFETFEFKPGGQWKFVMHGPPGNNGEPGTNYPNESVFKEIIPESRIVIEHVCQPWFTLTITLVPKGNQTHLDWAQEFESPEVAQKILSLIGDANEQNLNRMEAVLAEIQA